MEHKVIVEKHLNNYYMVTGCGKNFKFLLVRDSYINDYLCG